MPTRPCVFTMICIQGSGGGRHRSVKSLRVESSESDVCRSLDADLVTYYRRLWTKKDQERRSSLSSYPQIKPNSLCSAINLHTRSILLLEIFLRRSAVSPHAGHIFYLATFRQLGWSTSPTELRVAGSWQMFSTHAYRASSNLLKVQVSMVLKWLVETV